MGTCYNYACITRWRGARYIARPSAWSSGGPTNKSAASCSRPALLSILFITCFAEIHSRPLLSVGLLLRQELCHRARESARRTLPSRCSADIARHPQQCVAISSAVGVAILCSASSCWHIEPLVHRAVGSSSRWYIEPLVHRAVGTSSRSDSAVRLAVAPLRSSAVL